jgi:hypothetical protein
MTIILTKLGSKYVNIFISLQKGNKEKKVSLIMDENIG